MNPPNARFSWKIIDFRDNGPAPALARDGSPWRRGRRCARNPPGVLVVVVVVMRSQTWAVVLTASYYRRNRATIYNNLADLAKAPKSWSDSAILSRAA